MRTLILFWLLFFLAREASASVLSDAANALAVGSWVEITTNGNSVLTQPGADGNIISYAGQFVWDTTRKRGYFVGNDHIDGNTAQDNRFVYYDETTNTWANMPAGWSNPGLTNHAYYHNAIDTGGGFFYRRLTGNSRTVAKFNLDTHAWVSSLPNNNEFTFEQCCGGLSYFKEAGGLFWIQGDGGPGGAGQCGGTNCGRLTYFREATNSWVTVQSNIPLVAQPTFIVYSPVHKLLFYGDENHFWKMDDKRATTQVATPSANGVSFYTGTGTMVSMVGDPVSGDIIALNADDRVLKKYDPIANTWSNVTSTGKPNMANITVMATAVPEHGVMMWTYCQVSTCHTYLYKHASNANTSDYQKRAHSRGVILSNGFDRTADISGTWSSPPTHWKGIIPRTNTPVVDTAQRASGTGALRITIPSPNGTGAQGGDFFTAFDIDYDQQFDGSAGKNQLWVQYRVRYDSNFIAATLGHVGMKQGMITAGWRSTQAMTSCTDLEIVTQNNQRRGFPAMYQHCPPSVPFEEAFGGSDFKLQNSRPQPPGCLYSQVQAGTQFTVGNCIPYLNEWQTYTYRIDLGARVSNEFQNSRIRMWIARASQASEQVFDWTMNIDADDTASSFADTFGAIWLLAYSGDDQYPTGGQVWYDELIISKQSIADPFGTASSGQPAPPTGFIRVP